MFSKKATKIDEIFTVKRHSVKSRVKISSNFVAFLKNMNFTMNRNPLPVIGFKQCNRQFLLSIIEFYDQQSTQQAVTSVMYRMIHRVHATTILYNCNKVVWPKKQVIL